MLFQTQEFLLLFLPAVVLGYYLLAHFPAARITWLIAAGLVFYGWWDVRFLPLLVIQSLVSWGAVQAYFTTERTSNWIITLAIAGNLGVLVFFKYLNFLAGAVATAGGYTFAPYDILLPIGISFYTFEIVSYLADVRWHGAPRYSLQKFLLFVMLFPRLIAGPIVRHHEIIPQFDLPPLRGGLCQRVSKGAIWLTAGLAKKVLLADSLAPISDAGFAAAAQGAPDLATAWFSVLAFTFQLFLDFSAYTEMAIGIGLMLGFTLPQNFDAPYKAQSLRDFWRRWHITLSRFLRDYIYIPLGGSRHGAATFVFASIVTMAVCGLWHGAGFTFLAWGLWHGAGLIANRAWAGTGLTLPAPAAWLLTFLFVIVGWVLFRAPTFEVAQHMFTGLGGSGDTLPATTATSSIVTAESVLIIAAGAAVSIVGPTTAQAIERFALPRRSLAIPLAAAAAAIVLMVGGDQARDFIYFQF